MVYLMACMPVRMPVRMYVRAPGVYLGAVRGLCLSYYPFFMYVCPVVVVVAGVVLCDKIRHKI